MLFISYISHLLQPTLQISMTRIDQVENGRLILEKAESVETINVLINGDFHL